MVADGQLEGAQTPNATAPTKHTKASIVALRCAWEVPACNGYCLPVRVQERASPPLGARLRVPPKKGSRPAGKAREARNSLESLEAQHDTYLHFRKQMGTYDTPGSVPDFGT